MYPHWTLNLTNSIIYWWLLAKINFFLIILTNRRKLICSILKNTYVSRFPGQLGPRRWAVSVWVARFTNSRRRRPSCFVILAIRRLDTGPPPMAVFSAMHIIAILATTVPDGYRLLPLQFLENTLVCLGLRHSPYEYRGYKCIWHVSGMFPLTDLYLYAYVRLWIITFLSSPLHNFYKM